MYIAYTRLKPIAVEDGSSIKLGEGYVLYSRRRRFKTTLENGTVAKTVEVEGTYVEDLDSWLWEEKARALEAALQEPPEEDEVRIIMESVKKELKERGYAEIPANTRAEVQAALRLWHELKQVKNVEVIYYTVAAKYVFRVKS